MNVTSDSNFFLSQPAIWDYGMSAGEPQFPTIAGKKATIIVYEPVDDADGMLSPIHKACLDILQRLCQIRQAQNEASASEEPKTLDAFCDALRQRRWRNFTEPDKSISEDYYYAKSGGIEWLRNYYGARTFWADQWDTEQCTEARDRLLAEFLLLSAVMRRPFAPDSLPPLRVPQVTIDTYSTNSVQRSSRRSSWLAVSGGVDAIIGNDTGCDDWEQSIEALVQKANMMSADEGGVEEGNKQLASAPLGLKNRWRIWKILQGIEFRQDL